MTKEIRVRPIKLQVIKCLACYDTGQIIDPLDQSKRQVCHCQKPLKRGGLVKT